MQVSSGMVLECRPCTSFVGRTQFIDRLKTGFSATFGQTTRSCSARASMPMPDYLKPCSTLAVISDSLNHASIMDGIRLGKAKRFRYANNDMSELEHK
ncbi:7-keto-8-aminopelargonate synthetase-like enzyme [Bradyrhizobium sp. RT6a]